MRQANIAHQIETACSRAFQLTLSARISKKKPNAKVLRQ
jgi:hypothetical protein